ncbi:AMP nucleosidase [Polymorphobacter fuscus]|uniref:AMP nucleosidase n=1 Tax=Sandarakinorhabdus fusca TaxID=1439888 RepID=A0A7C9GPG2_9SPHN|nr:AMP nucleosidase [Polymorphobacter fuscus]KAB7647737.1 AMP nucleosidase [Polymorphobacter fuscus]MQT17033.1 AMP nucleosidase [Polymorphobacter fuscus]NJC08975.1 AMP nucleosidase [Polymorphobacter fuscus]
MTSPSTSPASASSELVDQLVTIHAESTAALRDALREFIDHGVTPDAAARVRGDWSYPELRVDYSGNDAANRPVRAFARLNRPGSYATTVTRPEMYRAYLIEQLDLLMADYQVTITTGRSEVEIPYPYVLDGAADLRLDAAAASELARWFPTTELQQIGDELPDGLWDESLSDTRPLALFDGPRTDFSLARLKHYTGTAPEDFQHYILLTNYHRYVDEFVRWGCGQLGEDGYERLSCPGGLDILPGDAAPGRAADDVAWRKYQMPAWHLKAPGRIGITLVNIGVGPANAKTICDHLAVLRPEAWLMIGHCGGLRPSQKIGDYVLAHAYLRDDHVLDDVLPPEIPIPALSEVQKALQGAAEAVTGAAGDALKPRLRTGTVVTTDDRNWELRFSRSALRFNQSRAVAIDMESATIAAQGYRFRVPYGTLLCVSDKPLHGEIKLPGQANRFYEGAISEHLHIGIEAVKILREAGPGLHSRKLRAFDEPPFR